MKLKCTFLIVVFCLSCAQKRIIPAQAIFHGSDIETVQAKLTELCTENGWMIQDMGRNKVLCGKELEQNVFGMMYRGFFVERGATVPMRYVQFITVNKLEGTKVFATSWIEHQGHGGKITKEYIDDPKDIEYLRKVLIRIGGQ